MFMPRFIIMHIWLAAVLIPLWEKESPTWTQGSSVDISFLHSSSGPIKSYFPYVQMPFLLL